MIQLNDTIQSCQKCAILIFPSKMHKSDTIHPPKKSLNVEKINIAHFWYIFYSDWIRLYKSMIQFKAAIHFSRYSRWTRDVLDDSSNSLSFNKILRWVGTAPTTAAVCTAETSSESSGCIRSYISCCIKGEEGQGMVVDVALSFNKILRWVGTAPTTATTIRTTETSTESASCIHWHISCCIKGDEGRGWWLTRPHFQ